ncbi:hypothetical protein D3C72_1481090 [compost metagenome]
MQDRALEARGPGHGRVGVERVEVAHQSVQQRGLGANRLGVGEVGRTVLGGRTKRGQRRIAGLAAIQLAVAAVTAQERYLLYRRLQLALRRFQASLGDHDGAFAFALVGQVGDAIVADDLRTGRQWPVQAHALLAV